MLMYIYFETALQGEQKFTFSTENEATLATKPWIGVLIIASTKHALERRPF